MSNHNLIGRGTLVVVLPPEEHRTHYDRGCPNRSNVCAEAISLFENQLIIDTLLLEAEAKR